MTNPFAISEVFLNLSSVPLKPKNAVAAIITDEDNHVLLQLRDNRQDIFFPHHWGCFGGAIEEGEQPMQTLRRELEEETGIGFDLTAVEPFIKIAFNTKPAPAPQIDRHFFLVRASSSDLKQVRLGEGSAYELFTPRRAMAIPNIVPYDRFGLWLYFNQSRMEE